MIQSCILGLKSYIWGEDLILIINPREVKRKLLDPRWALMQLFPLSSTSLGIVDSEQSLFIYYYSRLPRHNFCPRRQLHRLALVKQEFHAQRAWASLLGGWVDWPRVWWSNPQPRSSRRWPRGGRKCLERISAGLCPSSSSRRCLRRQKSGFKQALTQEFHSKSLAYRMLGLQQNHPRDPQVTTINQKLPKTNFCIEIADFTLDIWWKW